MLTRNPCSVWDSYAESFFDGDYASARDFNPIIYAMYRRWRTSCARKGSFCPVRYRNVVSDLRQTKRIYEHIGLEHERTVNCGKQKEQVAGLRPHRVKQHNRPVTASIAKWASSVAAHDERRSSCGSL